MKAVIQRVTKASLFIDKKLHAEIGHGLVVLLGVGQEDTAEDVTWMAAKIKNLRIFSDDDGRMNRSVSDISGAVLLVSQFTLFATTRKGNRPSFIAAAKPEQANALYQELEKELKRDRRHLSVKTGVFGAEMQIELINDGPVTILIDSKADF